MTNQQAAEVISKIGNVLGRNGFDQIDFKSISPLQAAAYVEQRYISPAFAKEKREHTLFLNEPCNLSVMACEEDHLRIQSIEPGLSLEKAYANAISVEEMLDAHMDIAFDKQFGYLTACPTNLGTGMRASIMVFLPGITFTGHINSLSSQLTKIGLTIRGAHGEGSEAQACVYQISNQISMGLSEEDIIKKLNEVVSMVVETETEAEKELYSRSHDQLTDRVLRAEGALKYAYMISSEEFMKHYVQIRLGMNLGIIKDIPEEQFYPLLIEVMPATLCQLSDEAIGDDARRDRARAAFIQKKLSKETE
ncbi:MAG: ATP--guanido phosphotransferase [Clostridia bacterium]|nr:ATP--guanido phosphotransferase [Clostridia bacterium]